MMTYNEWSLALLEDIEGNAEETVRKMMEVAWQIITHCGGDTEVFPEKS